MALVSSPLYPLAGQTVTLSITAAQGNAVVFELTSVPSESELSTGLLYVGSTITNPTPLGLVSAERNATSFIPDVAGAYGITAYDFRQVFGVASFEGDASGASHFTLSATQTGTVYVGDQLDLPIATVTGHGATLRLLVANDTVRSAELTNFRSERSRVASLTTATVAALAALVGVATSTLASELTTDSSNLRAKYELHRANSGGTYHRNSADAATPDATNIAARFAASASNAEAWAVLNDLHSKMQGHFLAGTALVGTSRWHKASDDSANDFVIARAFDEASATVLSAWLRSMYRDHIARTTLNSLEVHNVADSTNTVTAATVLEAVIIQYLKDIQSVSISSVTGENLGSIRLRKLQGFRNIA